LLPAHFASYREPLVGGGSVFLHLRQQRPQLPVWINDLSRPAELSDFERVVRFFVLNRTFAGTVEAGGYSQKAFVGRFTHPAGARLARLKTVLDGDVRVTNYDYEQLLAAPGRDVFIFLEPHRRQCTRLACPLSPTHPAALQIATALQAGCEAFLTNDAARQRVTDLRVLVLD
jgi:DNA adenine methylase